VRVAKTWDVAGSVTVLAEARLVSDAFLTLRLRSRGQHMSATQLYLQGLEDIQEV